MGAVISASGPLIIGSGACDTCGPLPCLFSITKGEEAGEFPYDLGTSVYSAVPGNTKSVTDGEIT